MVDVLLPSVPKKRSSGSVMGYYDEDRVVAETGAKRCSICTKVQELLISNVKLEHALLGRSWKRRHICWLETPKQI